MEGDDSFGEEGSFGELVDHFEEELEALSVECQRLSIVLSLALQLISQAGLGSLQSLLQSLTKEQVSTLESAIRSSTKDLPSALE